MGPGTGAVGPRGDAPVGWNALVERDAERVLIDRALARSARGGGRFIVVYGQAGIGRSSLLRAASLDAEARGLAVLEAAGSELERGYGFGIVRRLLESQMAALSRHERRSILARAGPAAESALGIAASDQRWSGACFEQIESVYRLIADLAARAPLLVIVDELQWCDRPSLDFLCFLGHRATQLPATIITAWRRGEPGVRAGRLQALAGRADTLFLSLPPLSLAGVKGILTRHQGSEPDEETVTLIYEQTGGQPFLLSELIAGLRLRGVSLHRDSGDMIAATTPESVRRNIVARLGRHPEAIRRFAHAAAVLGDASLDHAAALAGLDHALAVAAADTLARAGILRDDATVAYAQPLLQRAVYETLSSVERADLHHRAAVELCQNLPSDPAGLERIGEHLLHSDGAGDPRFAAVLIESAARAANGGAAAEARRFLERALGEVDDVRDRLAVLVPLAESELRTGDLEAASLHASEALNLASSPSERTAAALISAEAAAATTGWSSAVQLLNTEIQLLDRTEDELRLQMHATAAVLEACGQSPPWDSEAITGVKSLAGKTWAERAMLAALASQMVLTGAGSAEQVIDVCERALAGVTQERVYTADAAYYIARRAALLADAGDLAERTFTERSGPPVAQLALRSQVALARGDLGDAEADARTALGLLEDLWPTLLGCRIQADLLAVLSAVAIERSRYDEAGSTLNELSRVGDGPDPSGVPLKIALSVSQTRPTVALALAKDAEQLPLGIVAPGTSWRPWAALAHHLAHDTTKAVALADAHLEHARAWGSRASLGQALTIRGVVDPGPARLRFIEEAVAVLEETSAKLLLAHALVECGAALRRARRRREARDQLMLGADLAHRCGAEALSARARAELIGAGARPRRTAFSGVSSLTVSELRVARLAAAGMTNRAIAHRLTVSAKTVSGQLSAVYRKLDVHDRAALAGAMQKTDMRSPAG